MARLARVFAMFACAHVTLAACGCADNPYWIGHRREREIPDAAADECRVGALVCSGFETAQLGDEWPETHIENAAEVTRSSLRAHSGAASLRAQSRDADSVAVVVARFAPQRSGTLYLRAHLYVPDQQPTETMNVFFVGARPDPDLEPFVGMDLNLEQGALQLFSPQAEPRRQTGSYRIPRDRWFCLRAEIQIGDRAEVSVFADDQLALRATQVDSAPPEGVSMLRAGVDWSSEQQANFELFIDDLALDTQPVTCLTD
jgi:hypothetical protein